MKNLFSMILIILGIQTEKKIHKQHQEKEYIILSRIKLILEMDL